MYLCNKDKLITLVLCKESYLCWHRVNLLCKCGPELVLSRLLTSWWTVVHGLIMQNCTMIKVFFSTGLGPARLGWDILIVDTSLCFKLTVWTVYAPLTQASIMYRLQLKCKLPLLMLHKPFIPIVVFAIITLWLSVWFVDMQ